MDNDSKKRQINVRIDPEMYDFIQEYSKKNYKTITTVIKELIIDFYLRNKVPIVVKSTTADD